MTALDALAPTHAMFHHAAIAASTSAAAPSAPSAVKSGSTDIRKYIIVERGGAEYAVVFPLFIPHDKVCHGIPHKLVAAGSFGIINGDVFLTGVGSSTLNLNSRPKDAALIQALLTES
jgi:hypothetical protein